MTDPSPDELLVRAPLTRRSDDAAGATDVGRTRQRNEDAYWIDDAGRFALVADGLGGLPDGDVASRAAVLAAAQTLAGRLCAEREPHTAASIGTQVPATKSRLHVLGTALGEAFEAAQAGVLAQQTSTAGEYSMATTLIGAVIEGDLAVIVHVGDVRGYVWRGGRPILVTADHSAVGDLVRDGLLTREEARTRPDRNLVTEVLGVPEGYRAEVDAVELEDGDVVLLCSDGLWDAVDEDAMARLLGFAGSASEAAEWLVHAANAAGGHDNITAVVLRHGVAVEAAA